MSSKGNTKIIAFNLFIYLALIGFLSGLIAYAYMGSFMRTIGDDYCLGGTLQNYGLWGGTIYSYFNPVPYHGNRFSLIFLSLFFSLFQPSFNGLVPLIAISFFCFGLFFLIRTISSRYNLQISTWISLLIALAIIFFTFRLSPSVKQNLYWRTGMLSTLAPIIGNVFLIAVILRIYSYYFLLWLMVLVLSIINGAITENGASFQAMTGILVFFLGIIERHSDVKKRKSIIIHSLTIVVGSLIAVIIMWISPSIGSMKEGISPKLIDALLMSFVHAFDFFFGSIKSYYSGMTAINLFGFFLYFLLLYQTNEKKLTNITARTWGQALFVVLLLVYLLISSIMLPSAFTRNVYPDPRHLLPGVFAIVIGFIGSGFCLAGIVYNFVSKYYGNKWDKILLSLIGAFLLFVLSMLYPVRSISQITSEKLLFQYWAYQWDQRHEQIVESVKSGTRQVHVMTLDHIIEDVGELSPVFESNWYNLCAADFYNLQKIHADQPGWDEGFHEFINSQ